MVNKKQNKSWIIYLILVLMVIFIFLGTSNYFPKCIESVKYCCGELQPDGGCLLDFDKEEFQSFGWESLVNEKQKQKFIDSHQDCHMKFVNITQALFGYGKFIKEGCITP